MNERRIGKLVEYLRKTRHIRMKDIYQGICSESTYIRLETGEALPEFMTLSCIFSRLGKSVNKVSMMLTYEDYALYCKQEEMEQLILAGQYMEAEKIIEAYHESRVASLPPHRQYILGIKSAILFEQDKYQEARRYAEYAIKVTQPQFTGSFITDCLSMQEWSLILLWLQCGLYFSDKSVCPYCEVLMYNLKKRLMDTEMKVELLPKTAWLYAKCLIKEGKDATAGDILTATQEFLAKNTSLHFQQQILELRIDLERDPAKKQCLQRMDQALKWGCGNYEGMIETEKMRLWRVHKRSKLYLVSETIRQERRQNSLTQGALAEMAGVDAKTLSRIETGVSRPKPGTFQKIMEAVNREYDIYRTDLVTREFSLLETERQVSEEMMKANYRKARELLKGLEENLPDEYKENQQYIQYTKVILDAEEEKLEACAAIDLCIQAFEVTRPFDPESFKSHMLGVQEAVIVNYIARLYRKTGKKEQAIELLKAALMGYDESRVQDRYHQKELSLILESLACHCETYGDLEAALAYCERGLALQIECGTGGLLGSFLMQRTFIKEQQGKSVLSCRKEYCMIDQILELMGMKNDQTALRNYYRSRYGKQIADENPL